MSDHNSKMYHHNMKHPFDRAKVNLMMALEEVYHDKKYDISTLDKLCEFYSIMASSKRLFKQKMKKTQEEEMIKVFEKEGGFERFENISSDINESINGFKDRINHKKRNQSRRKKMSPVVGDYRTRQKKRAKKFEFSSKLDQVGGNMKRTTTDIMAEGLKSSNQNDDLIKTQLEEQSNKIKERLRQRSLASFNRSMGSKGGSFHIFNQSKKKTKNVIQRRNPDSSFSHQNILGELGGKVNHHVQAEYGVLGKVQRRPPSGGVSRAKKSSKKQLNKTDGDIIIL